MSLSRNDVLKVALLARLQLSDTELDELTEELSRTVEYVHQLADVDTEGVQPMAHAVDLENVLAEDQAQPSFDRDKMLANAPKRDDACYRVPPVMGDSG
ncbi:MAG: Asp-tRNA(Asn)/Glu-tRNA(Gln) amidotransferase subunit GatC [Planctomycetales bacterium]